MKKNREIELDIGVDPNALDSQWVDQSRVYFRYAADLADARRDLDMAKAELELTDAELDLAIRSAPSKYGLEKVTEAGIKAAIPANELHQKSHAKFLEKKHDVDVLAAAVSALDHRRKALENLVSLRLANYYSEPKAPEGAKDRMEGISKRSVRRKGREPLPEGWE